MEDYSQSVMIALLPTSSEWCNIELPHMTLVYVGETKDLKPSVFNELAKVASDISMLSRQLTLQVVGVEVFGGTEKVNALRFRLTPELAAMRRYLEKWNASQYKEFKPHTTIGSFSDPIGEMPRFVTFNKIMVGWGDDSLTFSLR